jgi:hypothetical protein
VCFLTNAPGFDPRLKAANPCHWRRDPPMEKLETDLETAQRCVREAENAVEQQRERLAKTTTDATRRHGTQFLTVLERCLVLQRRHLEAIRDGEPNAPRTVALADDTVQDCLDRARYAADRADTAKACDRPAWLEIAREWSSLAGEQRKKRKAE